VSIDLQPEPTESFDDITAIRELVRELRPADLAS
jgi:hypothetical protein